MTIEKKIRGALIVNAVLALFLFAGLLFPSGNSKAGKSARTLLKNNEVSAITIDHASVIRLVRTGTAWKLMRNEKALAANEARVGTFIKLLASSMSLSPVGKTEKAATTYLLDEEHRIEVTVVLAGSAQPLQFYVSPLIETADLCYLMFPGKKTVYKAQTQLAAYFSGKETDWLDLRVLPETSAGDVQCFSVSGFYEAYTAQGRFTRSAEGWNHDSAMNIASAGAVEAWLQSIVSAKAEDFGEIDEARGEKELALISLELGNGTTKQLRIFDTPDPTRFIIFATDSLDPFVGSMYTLETLLRKPEALEQ